VFLRNDSPDPEVYKELVGVGSDSAHAGLPNNYTWVSDSSGEIVVRGPLGGIYETIDYIDELGNQIFRNNGKYYTFNLKRTRISTPRKIFDLSTVKPPTGITYEGLAYRFEYPENVGTTWDRHEGNIASDHRYTKVGIGGVYGGTTQQAARSEIEHYNDLEGRISVNRNVQLKRVLDLTDKETRRQLGVSLDDITGESYRKTQQIGAWAKEVGYDGILAPSARDKDGSNIVILSDD
jgi:RES domain-containing protein